MNLKESEILSHNCLVCTVGSRKKIFLNQSRGTPSNLFAYVMLDLR